MNQKSFNIAQWNELPLDSTPLQLKATYNPNPERSQLSLGVSPKTDGTRWKTVENSRVPVHTLKYEGLDIDFFFLDGNSRPFFNPLDLVQGAIKQGAIDLFPRKDWSALEFGVSLQDDAGGQEEPAWVRALDSVAKWSSEMLNAQKIGSLQRVDVQNIRSIFRWIEEMRTDPFLQINKKFPYHACIRDVTVGAAKVKIAMLTTSSFGQEGRKWVLEAEGFARSLNLDGRGLSQLIKEKRQVVSNPFLDVDEALGVASTDLELIEAHVVPGFSFKYFLAGEQLEPLKDDPMIGESIRAMLGAVDQFDAKAVRWYWERVRSMPMN